MFKEAFVILIILFLFYLLCRALLKRNRRAAAILALTALAVSCLANIVYNARVMFPDFYLDTVGGRFRYGTFSGNLLAWSDGFMFQDEILFPILRGRSVSLDDTAAFYEKFFTLYSDSCTSVAIGKEARDSLLAHKGDFDFHHEFSCIGIMDYVTDKIPAELAYDFERERYPDVYINTASLKAQPRLTVMMDSDYTLYVMGESYYEEITGGTDNA